MRLALIVNGLYFISLFTPTARHARPHRFFAHAREARAERRAPAAHAAEKLEDGRAAETSGAESLSTRMSYEGFVDMTDYVPLAPPDAANRASFYVSGGRLHVSLSKDLTLVRRPGRTLLLSPSFSAPLNPSEEPDFVLLNFILYSGKETCPGDCPLTITADGATVWTSYSHGDSPGWQRERVPHSAEKLEDGRVVETTGAESLSTRMSYEGFIEMISARRVIVRLGPDWIELNYDQIEALRDMYRRLPQPPPPDDSNSY